MTEPQTSSPKSPVDPEALRQQLRADEDTAALAKNIGVEIEDYIDQVLFYVQNPEADPEMTVIADEDVERVIGETSEAFDERLQAWFAGVADGSISLAETLQRIKDEFGVDVTQVQLDAARVKWSGASATRAAPIVGRPEGKILGEADNAAAQGLRSQMISQRMNHGFRQRAVEPSVAGGGKTR